MCAYINIKTYSYTIHIRTHISKYTHARTHANTHANTHTHTILSLSLLGLNKLKYLNAKPAAMAKRCSGQWAMYHGMPEGRR